MPGRSSGTDGSILHKNLNRSYPYQIILQNLFLYLDMIAPSPFQWRTRDREPMDRKYVNINLIFDYNPLLNVTVNNCFNFSIFMLLIPEIELQSSP